MTKLRYKPITADGLWYIGKGKQFYYVAFPFATEKDALIGCIKMEAQEANDRVDILIGELENLGAIDENDPRGFLA